MGSGKKSRSADVRIYVIVRARVSDRVKIRVRVRDGPEVSVSNRVRGWLNYQ